MRAIAALLAVPLLLGACGGNSSAYNSAHDVAKAAGCTGIKQAKEMTLFATDEVECAYDGGFTVVDWFKDGASLDNFRRASTGSGYAILYGSDWAISCVESKAACDHMHKTMGGKLD